MIYNQDHEILDFFTTSLRTFLNKKSYESYSLEIKQFDGNYCYCDLITNNDDNIDLNNNIIPIVLQLSIAYGQYRQDINAFQQAIQSYDYAYVFGPFCQRHGNPLHHSSKVRFVVNDTTNNKKYVAIPINEEEQKKEHNTQNNEISSGISNSNSSDDNSCLSSSKKRSFSMISGIFSYERQTYNFVPLKTFNENILFKKVKNITIPNCAYDLQLSILIKSKTFDNLNKETNFMKRPLQETDEIKNSMVNHVTYLSAVVTGFQKIRYALELAFDESADESQLNNYSKNDSYKAIIYLGLDTLQDILKYSRFSYHFTENDVNNNTFITDLNNYLLNVVYHGGVQNEYHNFIGHHSIVYKNLIGPSVEVMRMKDINRFEKTKTKCWNILMQHSVFQFPKKRIYDSFLNKDSSSKYLVQ